jgi:DNA-binding MarR family transcriptional regulator
MASKSMSDKRLRVIKLTTVGQRAVEQALKALNLLEMQVVEELEDREVRQAVTVLKRVNQRIAARLRNDSEESD